MTKWHGVVGYNEGTVETEPGIWEPKIIERQYYGDSIKNRWKRQSSSESTNDDINVATDISIVADPYAMNHCSSMVYAELMGTKWKITDVDLQYPRLVLTLGGVWNGTVPEGSTE